MQTLGRGQASACAPESSPLIKFLGRGHAQGHLNETSFSLEDL